MPKITINGVPGADGDYELDLSRGFTYRESHLIKEIAGVRSGELEDAMTAGDTDVVLALAKIALDRAGRRDVSVDVLMETVIGTEITLGPTDAEVEAEKLAEEEATRIPPASAPSGRSETSGSETSSGDSMSNGSADSPETLLNPSGSLSLAVSSISDQKTSAP